MFLYLILMGLRAPACHINKARNWIAKPMLVKLAIRNCFWWWWRWWWVKMFWIFNCTCKIYGTEILFTDIVRVFWVDKLIKNWRHIQNINIENLLQIKMSLLRHRRILTIWFPIVWPKPFDSNLHLYTLWYLCHKYDMIWHMNFFNLASENTSLQKHMWL